MKNAKKVLYIAPSGNAAGGGELYVRNMARNLDRSRFEPIVMLPWEGGGRAPLEAFDVEVHVLGEDYWVVPPTAWYGFLDELAERVARIRALIEQHNIKLVQTNRGDMLEGVLAARLAGVHHIYAAHTTFPTCMPLMERLHLQAASYAQIIGELSTVILAVAQGVAATLSPPLPAEKLRTINNGIPLEQYDEALAHADGSLKKELGVAQDTILVAAAGRTEPAKGFEMLVDAAAITSQKLPNVHFLLAGGDASNAEEMRHLNELTQRVKALGITDRFTFLGFRHDVPRILAESDIFVLPSRSEAAPYVLVEAMAAQCAPIATRCGGFIEEVLIEDETGNLIDIGDTQALADRMLRLARDGPLRNCIAAAARERIVGGKFDMPRSVELTMQLYDEVLARAAPAPNSPSIQAFLHATHEIGALGRRVMKMEERLRSVESIAALVRNNPLYRGVRRLIRGRHNGPSAGE